MSAFALHVPSAVLGAPHHQTRSLLINAYVIISRDVLPYIRQASIGERDRHGKTALR
jgi:hypothetical protein